MDVSLFLAASQIIKILATSYEIDIKIEL